MFALSFRNFTIDIIQVSPHRFIPLLLAVASLHPFIPLLQVASHLPRYAANCWSFCIWKMFNIPLISCFMNSWSLVSPKYHAQFLAAFMLSYLKQEKYLLYLPSLPDLYGLTVWLLPLRQWDLIAMNVYRTD